MDIPHSLFYELYNNFNERKIDQVLSRMDEGVIWANGMEGGYVYGKEGVKEYWTKQFTQVSSKVTPVEISSGDEVVNIKVHQVVHDMNGNLLSDEFVRHIFRFRDDKITEFNIGEKKESI